MTPINFQEQNVVFAKEDQPEYLPLPAHLTDDGEVITCWRLSWVERIKIAIGRPLWFRTMTFKRPLQPIIPTLEFPFVK